MTSSLLILGSRPTTSRISTTVSTQVRHQWIYVHTRAITKALADPLRSCSDWPVPDLIISGADHRSIWDLVAIEWARRRWIVLAEIPPVWIVPKGTHSSRPGEIQEGTRRRRNVVLVNLSTHLLAFWDGQDQTTKTMIELMQSMGKSVEVVYVNDAGEVLPKGALPMREEVQGEEERTRDGAIKPNDQIPT